MIYFIGKTDDAVPVSSFRAFRDWAFDQNEYQFDIETNVTRWWCDKVIITMQFGDINEKVQWVIQWSFLTPEQKDFIKWVLEGKKTKLIHNAAFECIVCLFHGIRVQNVYDTMVIEMALNCGLLNYASDEEEEAENPEDATYYSLSGLCSRYMEFYLFKSEYQLSFGDDIMTKGKIIYAATDVKHLGKIRRMQVLELQVKDLEFVAALENEAVLGFSMMTYNGMELDTVMWRENIELAKPIVEQALHDLENAVSVDKTLKACAEKNNWLSDTDKLLINWKSPMQKQKIFEYFFPDVPGTSKAVLTKWIKSGLGTSDELWCIKPMLLGDYRNLEHYVMGDTQWLLEQGLMVPGGKLTIMWTSHVQVLTLLQSITPRLEAVNKRALEKVKHVITVYIAQYNEAKKLLSTYGEKFITDNVEPDGKVRSVFKQIVGTGRVSCVDEKTLIRTNIGLIPIGVLCPDKEGTSSVHGAKAYTHTGEYQRITHGIHKGYQEMFEVELDTGEKITCTRDHRFLTDKGWYSLEDILSSSSEHTIITYVQESTLQMFRNSKIKRVTPVGIRRVCDITVSTDHSYIGNGIVSHNSSPNMQNIPVKESVGLRYRNSFKCDDDEEYVGSDYKSQELVIMAYLSGEPAWIDALQKGKDLHSVCAELMYKRRWTEAAEPGCRYNIDGSKCNCPGHKKLRVPAKNLNFGIPYGMSHFKLSVDMKITVPEAKNIMDDYFRVFPKLDRLLKFLGTFGVTNGYIQTLSPFFRKRWFPFWKFARNKVSHFLAGVVHDPTLGSIERQSKNMPIQGSAADITKLAMVMTYWYLSDNDLWDKVKMRMQVHDALDTTSKKEYSEQWSAELTRIMEEAALYVIPNGLLKSETQVTDRWSK